MTGDGSLTLAHPVHGQTCHSRAGAWTEARLRYAAACRLRERAFELAAQGRSEFRLLDVGTGLGLNIAAALEALEHTPLALDVVTLESDRSVLEVTLALGPAEPPEMERHHVHVRAALRAGLESPQCAVPLGRGRSRLLLGDARVTIFALERDASFDAVFLDPFSKSVDATLWGPEFIAEIAQRMAPRSVLSTYTVSLAVRAALHSAGLEVGVGPRVGTKASGTLAGRGLDGVAFDPRTRRRIETRAAALRGEIRSRDGLPPPR